MKYTIDIIGEKTVRENVKSNYDKLYQAETKVADFVLNHPNRILEANVSETAELSGVSDATVVRFCKRIGYSGFSQMKLQLSHDLGRDSSTSPEWSRQVPDGSLQERLLQIADAIVQIAAYVDIELIRACAEAIMQSQTVYVIGNGYTKIIACDLIYRLTRKGIRCSGGGYAETDFENLHMGQKGDAAVFISRSGDDRKTFKEMELAKKLEMRTISLTDTVKCPMAQLADYALTTGKGRKTQLPVTENSSSLNMMALLEVLLAYVQPRRQGDDLLKDVLAEARL